MDPVIVVGAGPVGLAAALALARQEVPTVVLDEGNGLAPEGPRSIVLRPDTAAFLARIGYPRVAADACAWAGWRTVRRRSELLRIPLDVGTGGTLAGLGPAGGTPPAVLHLAQHRLQRGLRDAVAASPFIDLVTDSAATEIEQDGTGVAVHAGDTWWRGSYLIGCDGHRSIVRRKLGIRFPGKAVAERCAVATVRAELPVPPEAQLHRDPQFDSTAQELTLRPLPDHVWRMDWRLPPGAPAGPLPAEVLIHHLRAALSGLNEGRVPQYELIASADRKIPQRLALKFRSGRAFLAGDAAHLLGALGMQNLDEGLRDAENLSWKLAAVWHHWAPPALLDSYQRERRPSVIARLRAVDQALPLLHPANRMLEVRRSLLSGSLRRNAALLSDGSLGTGRLGAPPAYRQLPGEARKLGRGGGAAVRGERAAGRPALATELQPTDRGALVPDIAVTTVDGARDRLRARLGRGLLVVLVAPGTDVWASEHWLGAGLMPALTEATGSLPMPAELLVTGDYPGAAPHTVLLIRPDGYLAATLRGCSPGELWRMADLVRAGSGALAEPTGAGTTGAGTSGAGSSGAGSSGAAVPPPSEAKTERLRTPPAAPVSPSDQDDTPADTPTPAQAN